jgi:hypothetical protein
MDGFVKLHLERRKTTILGTIHEFFDGLKDRINSYEGEDYNSIGFFIGKWHPNGNYRISDFLVLCNNHYDIVPDVLEYLNPTPENFDSYSANMIHLSILHCFSRISTPVTTKIIENNYSYMIDLCRKYHIRNYDTNYIKDVMSKHVQHIGRILGYVVYNNFQERRLSLGFVDNPIVNRTCLWNTPLVQLNSAVDIAISFMRSLDVEEQRIGTNLIKWMGGIRADEYYSIMLDLLESTSDSDIIGRIIEYFGIVLHQEIINNRVQSNIPYFDEIIPRIRNLKNHFDPNSSDYEKVAGWKNVVDTMDVSYSQEK